MAWNGSDGSENSTQRTQSAKDAKNAKASEGGRGHAGRVTIPKWWRGAVALAIVVVGGGLAWWLFVAGRGDGEEREEQPQKVRSAIAEATPAIVPKKPKTEPAAPPKEIPYWERETTNGLTFRQQMKWKIHHRPPAIITNNTSLTEAPPAYAIFESRCDNDLAALLTVPLGTTAVGDPDYERWFTRDFLKSLETPIVIMPDDTPEQEKLKRDMIAAKAELKARHDAGEDIAQVMSETRRELQQLAVYKSEVESMFREMANSPGTTEQDIEDFLGAANALLDSKGIAPITLGPLAKLRLLRDANRQEVTQ